MGDREIVVQTYSQLLHPHYKEIVGLQLIYCK